jgi:hypothetical protein
MIIIVKSFMMQNIFEGLCNQNSMVYNAWIVMRLFYRRLESSRKEKKNILVNYFMFSFSSFMPRRMKPIILITDYSAELNEK